MSYTAKDIPDWTKWAEPAKFDELFKKLRKESPIVLVDNENFNPFYAITKVADIMEIESKPEVFLNSPILNVSDKVGEQRAVEMFGTVSIVVNLLSMDPPQHMVYRNLTQSWFNPGNLLKLKDEMKRHVRARINKMASLGGACDFAEIVARPYPLDMIMLILGLPDQDFDLMVRFTEGILASSDPDVEKSQDSQKIIERIILIIGEMNAYFMQVVEDRRKNPTEDLSTVLALAKIDGNFMPDFELMSYFMLILVAGNDTSAHSIGGSMLYLAEHPELVKELNQSPELIPQAVEEFIRITNPVKHMMRTAAIDCAVGEHQFKAGDRVMLCYQSACRDEDYVEEPFKFRIDRKPNKHLAFGYGPHRCLGQHLARMEMTVLFEELLPRLESVELNGQYLYTQSNFSSGIKKLPIKYKMN